MHICCVPETNTALQINYISTKLKKKKTDISKSQTYCWKAYIKSNIRKHSLHRITDPDENTEIQGEGNIMGLCTFLCTFKIAIIQRSLAGYSPWGCKKSDTTETT